MGLMRTDIANSVDFLSAPLQPPSLQPRYVHDMPEFAPAHGRISAMARFTLAAAALLGLGLLSAPPAEAQWGQQGGGYYGQQQPQWVPPKIARKQAQQQERFIEKFGVQPGYGQGYRSGPPYGNAYGQRRGYDDGYSRSRDGYGYRRDTW